jgi:hypothetical protein
VKAATIRHGAFDVAAQFLKAIGNIFHSSVVLRRHGVFCCGGVDFWVEGKVGVARQDVGEATNALEPEPLCGGLVYSRLFQLAAVNNFADEVDAAFHPLYEDLLGLFLAGLMFFISC